MLLFVLIHCFNILWASCHYPPPARPWGPLETAGACSVPGTLGQSVGMHAAARWGLRSPARGMAWKLGKGKGPPIKRSLTRCEFQQVLGQIWGPSLPGLAVQVTVPKPSLAMLKKPISRKCFTMRLCVGGISHVTVTHKPEHLLSLAPSLTAEAPFPLRLPWALISKQREWV